MSDSLMTPPEVYAWARAAYGRPRLDPCWHPAGPSDPYTAACLPENWGDAWHEDAYQVKLSDGESWAGSWVGWVAPDGLDYKWSRGGSGRWTSDTPGWVWLNPPYSDPAPWLCLMAGYNYGVALLKCDPSTKWWNRYVWPYARAVGFINYRLEYGRTDGGKQYKANFPSALVVYGLDPTDLELETHTAGDAVTWRHK